jgi:hypothetical protein
LLTNEGGPGQDPSIFDLQKDQITLGAGQNKRTSIDIKEELQQMSKDSNPEEKPSTVLSGSIRIKKSTHLASTKYRQIEIQQPLPRSKNISRQSMGGVLAADGPSTQQNE